MPEGYWFDGVMYRPPSGKGSYVHPNLKVIVEQYLEKENETINIYNWTVYEQLKIDEQ